MIDLMPLSELLKEKNAPDLRIAAVIGRPALNGHIGEYIAAAIFTIMLEQSAVAKGRDGHFVAGPLAGRSVNVKWYAKQEASLDITLQNLPDEYLVLAGPRSAAMSSRGGHRPAVIVSVFLFDAPELVATIQARGSQIGDATSVPRQYWNAAEVYPVQRNMRLMLSEEQRARLALFA